MGEPKKIKNCENLKKIETKKRKKNDQTQLKTTGRNVEGEEKKLSEKYENAALKVSGQN